MEDARKALYLLHYYVHRRIAANKQRATKSGATVLWDTKKTTTNTRPFPNFKDWRNANTTRQPAKDTSVQWKYKICLSSMNTRRDMPCFPANRRIRYLLCISKFFECFVGGSNTFAMVLLTQGTCYTMPKSLRAFCFFLFENNTFFCNFYIFALKWTSWRISHLTFLACYLIGSHVPQPIPIGSRDTQPITFTFFAFLFQNVYKHLFARTVQ